MPCLEIVPMAGFRLHCASQTSAFPNGYRNCWVCEALNDAEDGVNVGVGFTVLAAVAR